MKSVQSRDARWRMCNALQYPEIIENISADYSGILAFFYSKPFLEILLCCLMTCRASHYTDSQATGIMFDCRHHPGLKSRTLPYLYLHIINCRSSLCFGALGSATVALKSAWN